MKINYIRAISYFGGGLVYGYFTGSIVDWLLTPYGPVATGLGVMISLGIMLYAMVGMPPIIETSPSGEAGDE